MKKYSVGKSLLVCVSKDSASRSEAVVAPAGCVVAIAVAALGPRPAAVALSFAALLMAESVMSAGARVTELVACWVVRRTSELLGVTGASGNADVADGLNSLAIAGAAASVFSEPGVIALPVGDDEGHAVGDVASHAMEVVAVLSSHGLSAAVLAQRGGEAGEVAGRVLVESDLGMEGLLGVDRVLSAGTIAVPGELVNDVLSALARAIAPVVVTLGVGGVAGVGSRGPGVLVTLLEVELGAESATPVSGVGVAVEVAVSVPEGAIGGLGGHGHRVEGVEAAALMLAHVDVPLDGATKEVGGEEVGVALVEVGVVDDEAAVVHVADELGTIGGAPVGGNVLLGLLAVNGDGDGSVVSVDKLLVLEDQVLESRLRDHLSLNGNSGEGSNEGAHGEAWFNFLL
mmetsp:Transcript_20297/g.25037  ORF Transcript_20297/g.25037 Transcript_20297/m.25037 type:complete len:401 (-) Transcript_20297:27-1229(-)